MADSAQIHKKCINARTMKPKTATTSIKVSRDSFESPPISMAYSEGVIHARTPGNCSDLGVISQPVALRGQVSCH